MFFNFAVSADLVNSPKKYLTLYAFFYRPSNGGKYCIGRRTRYRSCNLKVDYARNNIYIYINI